MADVTLQIEAEGVKALRELVKVSQELKNVEKQTRKTNKASKDGTESARTSTNKLASSWGNVGAKAGTAIAGMLSIGTVNGLLKEFESTLNRLSQRSNTFGRSAASLAALQKPGEEGKILREAAISGAQFGVKPADSAQIFQTLQSVNRGDLGATKADFATSGRLSQFGVANQEATDIIRFSRARGLSGAQGASLAFTAAEESDLDIGAIAKAVPSTSQFSSMEQGLAVLSVLSKEIPAGRLPEMLRNAATGLNANDSKLAKKFKLKGLSESERIASLAQSGVGTSIEALQAFGLQRTEAEGIGGLIRQQRKDEGVTSTLDVLSSTGPGVLKSELSRIRDASPIINQALLSDQAIALNETRALFGRSAEGARSLEARRLEQSQQLMTAFGGTFGIGEDGMPTFMGGAVAGFGDADKSKTSQERLIKEMERNTAELRKFNEARTAPAAVGSPNVAE